MVHTDAGQLRTAADSFLQNCRLVHALVLASVLVYGPLYAAEGPEGESFSAVWNVPPNAPVVLRDGEDRDGVARAHRRLHPSLERLFTAHGRLDPDPIAASGLPRVLFDAGRVLVEIRYEPGARTNMRLPALGADIRHVLAEGVTEAWVPIARLDEVAELPGTVRVWPAPLVQPLAGSVTSEGVAAGNAGLWHAGELDGEGVTIAIIDSFDDTSGQISDLQSSGDWPPDERLSTVKVGDGSFGDNGVDHGNAVLEIAYDVAPRASYIAYDTVFVSDWIDAINQAVDAGADIISASLGAPLNGIGDGSALPGSVAEAVEAAEAAGAVYINAAGNSRERHWGGLYRSSNGPYPSLHAWDGFEMEVNFFGPGNGNASCLPDGEVLRGELFWDDWDNVDHDYDLILFEYFENTGWQEVDRSDDLQIGLQGQRPQESLRVIADSGNAMTCGGDSAGVYGWAVLDDGAETARNLQFFANHTLERRVEARSLGFPADSPSAISVAALNVNDSTHEFYSSEGPILAPGGGLPTGSEYPKPDVASFARVSTATSGSFAGTSAAAPHVAGMAALLMQRHPEMTQAEVVDRMQEISVIGSNDLGDAGHDFQHGNGRLSFQVEETLAIVQQPTDTGVDDAVTPPVELEILDTEGFRVLSGPTIQIDTAIGNDPSGGGANLAGTTSRDVIDGLAWFDDLSIDAGGAGYTLVLDSIGAGSVESTSFDINDPSPAALVFDVQPGDTQINESISPAVVIQVLDANGSLVTDDNSTEVQLTLVAGPAGASLSGGGPLVVSNGEVQFSDLSIDEVGSEYRLEVSDTAGELESDTSTSFGVIAGDPDSLAFVVQPSDAEPGALIEPAVEIEIRDAFGNRVEWDNETEVSLTLGGGSPGASLSGGEPLTVSDGRAIFSTLSVDLQGTGYQLQADDSDGLLEPASSNPFDIVVDSIFADRFETPED